MARNKGISPFPDRSAVCATLTPLPCRQPARLRERLLGAVWAILVASGAVPIGRRSAACKHPSLPQTVDN